MVAATLYQWKYDRKHNLWNLGSTERYILHMRVLLFVIFGVYMSQYTSVPRSNECSQVKFELVVVGISMSVNNGESNIIFAAQTTCQSAKQYYTDW